MLDRKGLDDVRQMTAGSWIYIGSQGIVQGTYETFVELGRQHYGGDLSGRWILTGGLGGMGGAQPLAAVMAGASLLAVECQPSRIEMRLRTRYLDRQANNLDEALAIIVQAGRERKPVSVGLLGNAAEIFPELVRRGVRPDVVTDQTSAHDPVNGYLPKGWTTAEWETRRESDPKAVAAAARASMAEHVQAMLDFHRMGIPVVDYGNNIRQMALEQGVKDAFDFPGFVPAYIRPLFCRGIGPFRWAALSGDPEDIYRTDAKVKELLPDNKQLHNWLDMAKQRIAFQGLPARICWVGLGDRHRLGLAFNEMVARGELKAPVVIGRDHLDAGSVASPNRETEAMRDGSDAVSTRADAQRVAQLRERRHLGVAASWRRRRHGIFAACRHGDRVRRNTGGRGTHRPRAVERSCLRRDAARRCRLRYRDRLCQGTWARFAEPELTAKSVDIIRASDMRSMPWKNGGGSTTEIAAGPPGASLDSFDWRISMARVAADGPFSHFASIDRTLAVVAGDGIVLQVDGRAPITLVVGSEPVFFAGDTPTSAKLIGGEITDLNIMTRRVRFGHSLRRIAQPISCDLAEDVSIAIVLSLHGRTVANTGAWKTATLHHGDAAVVSRPQEGKKSGSNRDKRSCALLPPISVAGRPDRSGRMRVPGCESFSITACNQFRSRHNCDLVIKRLQEAQPFPQFSACGRIAEGH